MAAITALLEEIRGEQAPGVRFDPRSAGVPRDRRPATPTTTTAATGGRA